jgi:bacterioferritin
MSKSVIISNQAEIDLQSKSTLEENKVAMEKSHGEYALSEKLRGIIAQEQNHEIDLKDALQLR